MVKSMFIKNILMFLLERIDDISSFPRMTKQYWGYIGVNMKKSDLIYNQKLMGSSPVGSPQLLT